MVSKRRPKVHELKVRFCAECQVRTSPLRPSIGIYFKTDLALDALADTIRQTLNIPAHNRTPAIAEQKRRGLNRGGDYYLLEAFGLELLLLRNAGEAAIPERPDSPYYLLAEGGPESDLESVDCMTRQIYAAMRRTGLQMELDSLAA